MSSLPLRFYHRLPAPARSLAATMRGWYLRWSRYGRETPQLVAEAHERERWSAAQWDAWRQERLGYILHRAATRVPFYRAQWAERRRRGDRASWELLENWPILDNDRVRENPRAFIADDQNPRWMFNEHTSGTSGRPLVLWRTHRTMRALHALAVARTRLWHGVSRTDRWAMLGGQLVVPVAARRPPFWVWNAALRQLYMSTYHLAPDLIGAYLDALQRYRIVYLAGYTSSLYALAQEVLRLGRTDVTMRVALTSAEPLPEWQRQTIAAAFCCPVRETYGMSETVAWASECEAGTLHIWPEVGLIEVLADGVLMPPGEERGEFICTGLLNADFPLIRCRLGDSGRLAPPDVPCMCGRSLPALAAIDGRTNDLLLTRDGRRVAWLNPVWYGLPVRQGQIVQETLDRIRVRYVPADGFSPESRHLIVQRLHERLGPVHVLLEEVPEIPRGANGKFRAVLCALPGGGAERVVMAGERNSR
jgi:phenylacetate-coenzyme A ligase PaaK-like adenylate-forming protein